MSAEAQKSGNPEKANDLTRIAKETRTKAFLLGKEGEAEEHNAAATHSMPTSFPG